MRIIEPCCATKQFMFLRDAIGNKAKTQFKGFGDLSLTELLPALLTRYSETTMMIVAPSIPDQAADIIYTWLSRTWARMDGKGRLNVLSKLTIIADLSEEASPAVNLWLTNNPFPDRLVLVNKAQDDTALLLPDIAITGPLNFRYDKEFVCDVTAIPEEVSALWKTYSKLSKKRSTEKKKTTATATEKEVENAAVPADTKDVASSSSAAVESDDTTTLPSDSSTQQTPSEDSL